MAWRRVIDSSCHDSVTGCGVDETAVQVLARLQEGEHAAQAVRDRALAAAEAMSPAGSVVVANPLATQRDDVIDVTLPVPERLVRRRLRAARRSCGRRPGDLTACPLELASERVRSGDLPRLMHRVHDRELFGLQMRGIEIDEAAQRLTFQLADHGDPDFDAIAAEARLRSCRRRHPGPTRSGTSSPRTSPDAVSRPSSPRPRWAGRPFASPSWPLGRAAPAHRRAGSSSASETGRQGIRQGERVLDNGLVQVRVDDDGTLTVTADGVTLRGVGRLVDGGDPGDSYNYAPPAHDVLVSEPTQVSVTALGSEGRWSAPCVSTVATSSPSRATLPVGRTPPSPPRWRCTSSCGPASPSSGSGSTGRTSPATTGCAFMSRPPEPAAVSHAQGQLAVVERGRTAEAGPVGEHPLPTFPAERFVDAGGVAVLLGRTVEYEIVDSGHGPLRDGTEIAVTVLRSIGYLSRNVHPYRSEPAGPQLPTPDAQALGPCHRVAGRHAAPGLVGAGRRSPRRPRPSSTRSSSRAEPRADATPLRSVEGLTLVGAGVQLVSLRRRADADTAVEVRVVNIVRPAHGGRRRVRRGAGALCR